MLTPALASFVMSLLATPLLIAGLSHLHVIDNPNHRSSHTSPTLRGGGAAVAIGSLGAVLIATDIGSSPRVALLVAAGLFGLVGLLEDLKGVHPFGRLGLQVLAALVALAPLLDHLSGHLVWRVTFATAVVVWIVGYVNVFNFMDGINGISVAQAFVAGSAFAVLGFRDNIDHVAVAGAIIAASAIGFAPFNFPRARVFLGDVGSYFMGAWLAVVVVLGLRAGLTVEAMLAPLALYVADVTLTLARRVRNRATLHEAHHEHVYQQLIEGGWTHTRTTAVVGAVTSVCAGLGSVSLHSAPVARIGADVLVGVLLVGYLLLPSLVSSFNDPSTTRRYGELRSQHPDSRSNA